MSELGWVGRTHKNMKGWKGDDLSSSQLFGKYLVQVDGRD